LTVEDIASFPLLAPGVTLRVDLDVQWDGRRLLMTRMGLTQAEDGTVPVYCVEADSEAAAMDTLRMVAKEPEREAEAEDIFHFSAVESKTSYRPQRQPFVKPWKALSPASAKTIRCR
jgi:hypothetical protein